ncbi:hypothetical protein ACFYWP_27640 [Actinacidiphila glaucinigra]|uniref:hypothetical protein n=1 Tax=Actinacidiphila glaucinigra TaxID=235986 RepID=UPI00367E9393
MPAPAAPSVRRRAGQDRFTGGSRRAKKAATAAFWVSSKTRFGKNPEAPADLAQVPEARASR